MSRRLLACLLNISEARNLHVVEEVALAACGGNGVQSKTSCTVLNVFCDKDYNRSVLTIVAPAEHIIENVVNAAIKASERIDLRHHQGGHPRLGAVDLIPIHPLSPHVSLQECGDIAIEIANRYTSQVSGSSAFLFGHADRPHQRGLVQRRKEVKWYSGKQNFDFALTQQDVGAVPTSRYGLTGIGANPYVMNCNVTIDTEDLELGQRIAKSIRATTRGGFPGVQSMAFSHDGQIEIACNVESFIVNNKQDRERIVSSSDQLVCNFGNNFYVPGHVIEQRVASLAREKGVNVFGTSLVGFTPEGASELANQALDSGQSQFWKTRQTVAM